MTKREKISILKKALKWISDKHEQNIYGQVHPQHKIMGLVIMLVLFVTALALGILSVYA